MILQTPAKLAQVNLDQNQIVNFERQELEGAESASKGNAHRYGTPCQKVTVTATQHQHAEIDRPAGRADKYTDDATYRIRDHRLGRLPTFTDDEKGPGDGTFSLKAYMGHNDKNLIVNCGDTVDGVGSLGQSEQLHPWCGKRQTQMGFEPIGVLEMFSSDGEVRGVT